jgi:hypothetical protein
VKRPGPLRRRGRRKGAPLIWRHNLGPCAVCPVEGVECHGQVTGHHIITQQQLRQHGLELELWNLRNRLPVCDGRHGQHHRASRRIPRSVLPVEALEFAEEHGLTRLIERYYPERPRS